MANSRRYYSEYIGHFVRFFLIYPGQTRFRTPMEKQMYMAVNDVWNDMIPSEQEILKRLYLAKPFSAEVPVVAKEYGLAEPSIWKMVLRFEDEIARAGQIV